MYWKYAIPRAFQSLRTNWRTTLYNILIIAASFAMLGIGILLYLNVIHISRIWLANTTVSLFLEPQLAAEQREALLAEVQGDPAVAQASSVSPTEGLRDLAQKLGGSSSLLEGIGLDSLPYTIDLELHTDVRERIRNIARELGELPGVAEVVYAERMLDRVHIFLLVTQAVGLFFVGLILLSFLFIVSNSTKLSLHTRREEIQILAAVGATRQVIGSSFVVEGMVLAGAGFILALALTAGCYLALVQALTLIQTTAALAEQALFFAPQHLALALLAVLLLGGLGSRLSVGRLLQDVV